MNKQKESAFQPTAQLYTTLFNGITDARKQLKSIEEMLDKLQQTAEKIYIEKE